MADCRRTRRNAALARDRRRRSYCEQIPVTRDADVLIAGGGLSGVMAALSAARAGADTILVERAAFLGSNATTGLPLLSFHDILGNRVIRGFAQELIERLKTRGAATGPTYCPLHCSIVIVDPEELKNQCLLMLEEAGVAILLDTAVSSTIVNRGHVDGLVIETVEGRGILESAVVIDASGDAAVAVAAGAPWAVGDPITGGVQPPTLMFHMSNVDTNAVRAGLAQGLYQTDISERFYSDNDYFWAVGFRDRVQQAKRDGALPGSFPMDTAIFGTLLRENCVAVNMAKVAGVNCANAADLGRAEVEARRLVPVVAGFLNKYIPGFEQASVCWIAPRIGIRETRRIVGAFVLESDDLMKGMIPDDTVALGGYMVDVHPADGGAARYVYPKAYGIPYRSLVPQGIDNLLVVGRCISVSHEALGSTRVMVIGMALGQVAGTAAAICSKRGISTSAIGMAELQEKLVEQGVLLRPQPEFQGYSPYQ